MYQGYLDRIIKALENIAKELKELNERNRVLGKETARITEPR